MADDYTNRIAEKPWPHWVCTYRFEGTDYGITIPARTRDEAWKRLWAIGNTGTVDGELMGAIPAVPGMGWLVRAVCFMQNRWAFFAGFTITTLILWALT